MFGYPITRDHNSVEVNLLERGEITGFAFLDLREREVCERGKTMVELMKELGLVKWQVAVVI